MKKILLPALALALSACTMTTPASPPLPASGVTGTWQGTASAFYLKAQLTAYLALQDTPNPGDFTGTLKIASPEFTGTVRGNVNTGEIVATSGTDSVSCHGKFSQTENGGGRYDGSCAYSGVSGSVVLTRQSK